VPSLPLWIIHIYPTDPFKNA